jgi:hypothetical protein
MHRETHRLLKGDQHGAFAATIEDQVVVLVSLQ